jgi:hypothetical protein
MLLKKCIQFSIIYTNTNRICNVLFPVTFFVEMLGELQNKRKLSYLFQVKEM